MTKYTFRDVEFMSARDKELVLKHTKGEHQDLDLGTIRWHLVVHNIQSASYTLSGGGTAAQFD